MSSTECSWCLSVLKDQVTSCCFGCSAIQPWHVFLINYIQEKGSFRGHDISEELSPTEVLTDVTSTIEKFIYIFYDTEVYLYLAPCQCAYCILLGRIALNY